MNNLQKKSEQENIKSILDFINQKDFFKLYSRNTCLQITEIFSYYAPLELNKMRGLKFDQLAINKNEFVDCYGGGIQLEIVSRKIRKIYDQSKSIKDYYEFYALPSFKEYIEFTRKMNKKYSQEYKYSSEEVLKDYDNFSKIIARLHGNLWFIFLSDSVIDEMLKDSISKQEYLELVSTPLKRTAIPMEHEGLLKIASTKKGHKHEEQIKKHCEKWKWFPCYNPCDDVYNLTHYKDELRQYTTASAKEELKKMNKDRAEHKKAYNKFLESIKDKKLIKIVKMTNEICFYREYRNDLRREGLYLIKPLYERIGEFFGLNITEACYLMNEEIKNSLKTEKLQVSNKIIRNRINKYVLFVKGKKKILIDDNKRVEEISAAIIDTESKKDVIKGSPASGGFVRGRVFVISNINKLKDFKEGDVLVASMTAPDYVPAMKKASAIITDEGGITCHAAIVAREMKKPCIIGTKLATKILKDGDLVEVDANNGVIKILKNTA